MTTLALPPELPQSSKTLTAHCYCKSIHFTITVPSSSLPLPVHLCHCPTCRYTHGTLCIFHAPLPSGISPTFIAPSSLASATAYRHRNGALSDRFFCSTCGCHIGDRDITPEDPSTGHLDWRVATSIFTAHDPSTFQLRSHVFTASAPGGGLYTWLSEVDGRPLHVWNPSPSDTTLPPAEEPSSPPPEVDAAGNERLRAQCHCGGVSFTIPRSTAPAVAADARLRTYASPVAGEEGKWLASLDACADCRLVDGAHVAAWAFVPRALLEPRVPPDLHGFGTMQVFESGPGVLRTFCRVCGATVFYDCEERRDRDGGGAGQVVDLAIGLLRAPGGVLAEDWLTWRAGRVAWFESGERFDAGFTRSLARGLDEWGRRKYGRSLNFEIL